MVRSICSPGLTINEPSWLSASANGMVAASSHASTSSPSPKYSLNSMGTATQASVSLATEKLTPTRVTSTHSWNVSVIWSLTGVDRVPGWRISSDASSRPSSTSSRKSLMKPSLRKPAPETSSWIESTRPSIFRSVGNSGRSNGSSGRAASALISPSSAETQSQADKANSAEKRARANRQSRVLIVPSLWTPYGILRNDSQRAGHKSNEIRRGHK